MILGRNTPCQVFNIRKPVWGGRKVGLATYKVGSHNQINIEAKSADGELIYPMPLYMSGEKIRTYPIEGVKSNPNIKLFIVPISDLEPLERM